MNSAGKFLLVFLCVFLAAGIVFAGGGRQTGGEKGGYVIGFSNSFNGNTCRQAMESRAREAAEKLKAAGLPLPVIGGDNRGFFLKWWANEAPGYNSISVSSNPRDGATAVYAAAEILNEARPSKTTIHPFGVVTEDQVQQFRDAADEAIACPAFDREWVRQNILNQ
jgi:ABC-type sugar transport system substrate-binding protein